MTRGKVAPALIRTGNNLDHESLVALRRPKMQTDGQFSILVLALSKSCHRQPAPIREEEFGMG